MEFKANPIYKPSNFQMDVWQVEKLVELPAPEFDALVTTPLADHPVIAENKKYMFSNGGTLHALLVLGEGRRDGVLVMSEKRYDFVRYGAYVTGARDIVNAELERAADLIIRRCTENTGGGSWHAFFNNRPGRGGCSVGFEELKEQLDLTIRDGNGLDAMLMDTLRRRPGVSTVELDDGCISIVCDLSPRKDNTAVPRKKASVPLTMKRKADLFENAVSTVCEIFRDEDVYTMLHGSFGLTIQEIRAQGYLSDQELCDICHVPQQVLEGGVRVRDILQLDGVSESASLAHKDSTVLFPLEDLKKLITSGQEDFTALLDARVADIRVDEEAPELVLEGVEAAELERLHDVLEAQGQTMGPAMG